jgi:uncharacterized protein YhbP (UPF0306 family)
MEPRITRFLKHHHVLNLATSSDQGVWVAHCFYAFMPDYQALVFTSGPDTRHGQNMLTNPNVSCGIALETKAVGLIRGVQLSGRVYYTDVTPDSVVIPAQAKPETGTPFLTTNASVGTPSLTTDASECRSAYLRRFPFALAAKLDLWVLYIDYLKMTDNRLGFGKKLEWRRPK